VNAVKVAWTVGGHQGLLLAPRVSSRICHNASACSARSLDTIVFVPLRNKTVLRINA